MARPVGLGPPFLLGELRQTQSATTGVTPSELLYGCPIRGPLQMLCQKWTNDYSVPTSVVQYMTSIQDHLNQIKELANDNKQKSKVIMAERQKRGPSGREKLFSYGLRPCNPKWKMGGKDITQSLRSVMRPLIS